MTDYPTYAAKRVTIDTIIASHTYSGMHPNMRGRVRRLIESSGGKLGLGQGLRDPKQQLQLFLNRHAVDPHGGISYDGKRWRLLPGNAPAAPPGRSMHEIGLAADMVGDVVWLRTNAKSFDLQTFENVNHEPWHVQPTELPRSRSSYERNPRWGLPPWTGDDGPRPSPVIGGMGVVTSDAPLTPALEARPGDTGPAVAVLEEALIARGVVADTPASRGNSYGPDVVKLVEDFQRHHGLAVDGKVGPRTWGPLLEVVKPGETGPFVRVLQVTLIVRGLIRDNAANHDGDYGTATQGVVRQFQRLAGLGVDAKVGPRTWTILIGMKKRLAVPTGGERVQAPDDTYDLDDIDMLAVYAGVPAI